MAFHPTTDVVLDVINAADPARASLAAERLAALAAGKPAGDFALDLNKAASAATDASAAAATGLADARNALTAVTAMADPAARAKVEFEAMAVDGFVRDLLPKDAPAFFGEGVAGDIWRSMLSEQISRQIAKSGALGLSRRLFATHEIATGERRAGASAATSAGTSANILSTPAAADIVEGAVLTAGRRA